MEEDSTPLTWDLNENAPFGDDTSLERTSSPPKVSRSLQAGGKGRVSEVSYVQQEISAISILLSLFEGLLMKQEELY